ncbi:MAG: integrase core domain-containing protein [Candidatus Bathyarchaeia archaeon]
MGLPGGIRIRDRRCFLRKDGESRKPPAFREGYTVEELNEILDERSYVYNYVRPHRSLGYLTPMEFLNAWMEECKDRGDVFTM